MWVVIAVLCVALFAGAYMLYDRLKDDYAPSNLAPTAADAPSEAVETAPDFSAQDENGNTVKLSDYFGTPIVLNLWASWCPPCKGEMPYFEAACRENPDIQFLMVNMTTGDNMADAKALIAEQGYTFPVLFDTMSEAAIAYNATSLPMTFFIGADGAVVTHAVGALDEQSLNSGIDMIKN